MKIKVRSNLKVKIDIFIDIMSMFKIKKGE